jgi:hypothetical protein
VRTRDPIGRGLGVLALAVLIGACSNGPAPRAERDLSDRVAAVRAAAESGDRDAARQRLQQLIDAVNGWRSQGAIDDGYASSILTAVAAVDDQLNLLPSPAAGSPTPAAASTSPPHTPPGQEEGHGHGNDEHGNGNGNANGHD